MIVLKNGLFVQGIAGILAVYPVYLVYLVYRDKMMERLFCLPSFWQDGRSAEERRELGIISALWLFSRLLDKVIYGAMVA